MGFNLCVCVCGCCVCYNEIVRGSIITQAHTQSLNMYWRTLVVCAVGVLCVCLSARSWRGEKVIIFKMAEIRYSNTYTFDTIPFKPTLGLRHGVAWRVEFKRTWPPNWRPTATRPTRPHGAAGATATADWWAAARTGRWTSRPRWIALLDVVAHVRKNTVSSTHPTIRPPTAAPTWNKVRYLVRLTNGVHQNRA